MIGCMTSKRFIYAIFLVITLQYGAEAQIFKINDKLDINLFGNHKIIFDVYSKKNKNIKVKLIDKYLFLFSSEKDDCNNLGCKTLIIDTSSPNNTHEVILSNGTFFVSDSFISSFGNGTSVLFYRDNHSPIGIKFMQKYQIIE